MNFLRAQKEGPSIQEKAALVCARLKSATYPGDKIEAAKQASEISKADSVVAGTELMSALADAMTEEGLYGEESVFSALENIFEGESGKEFLDIFYTKGQGVSSLIKVLSDERLLQGKDRGTDEERFGAMRRVALKVVAGNPREFGAELQKSPESAKLLSLAFRGEGTVLDILRCTLSRSSNMRQFLLFQGYIEGMMRLSSSRDRDAARKALLSVSDILRRGKEAAEYFFGLGEWKQWLEHMLSAHPYHGLKVLHSVAAHAPARRSSQLLSFLERAIGMKDLLSLFLLTDRSPRACFEVSRGQHAKQWQELKGAALKGQKQQSLCMTRLNLVVGVEFNLSRCSSEIRGHLGDAAWLGSFAGCMDLAFSASSLPHAVDESDLVAFLFKSTGLGSMGYAERLIYMKTAGILAMYRAGQELFNLEILATAWDVLRAEETPQELKALSSLWLGIAAVDGSAHGKELFIRSLDDSLSSIRYLAKSVAYPYTPSCGTLQCKRCYFRDICPPGLEAETCMESSLGNSLWFPSPVSASILGAVASILAWAEELLPSSQMRKEFMECLEGAAEAHQREGEKTKTAAPAASQTPAPESSLHRPSSAPHRGGAYFDL